MNIEYKAKIRKESKHNNNRFYTSLDMAIIKKDAANRNGFKLTAVDMYDFLVYKGGRINLGSIEHVFCV